MNHTFLYTYYRCVSVANIFILFTCHMHILKSQIPTIYKFVLEQSTDFTKISFNATLTLYLRSFSFLHEIYNSIPSQQKRHDNLKNLLVYYSHSQTGFVSS